MISIGSGDARKGLGLGICSGKREMEETELEEGEACSYRINDDCDASVDPDVALSYIDEKLQDVLGHFQKDFEGGVSAENLGAKFGGYGSFLPSYQRSPGSLHPKTSPEIPHNSTTRSPNILQLESGRRTGSASLTAPQKVRLGASTSSSVTSLPSSKLPSLTDSIKQETWMTSSHGEGHEYVNKKPSSLADQKTLKLRIKVGSDNLSVQKNAAIYSGLGLNVSPSSSMENSPSESEGMYHGTQDAPYESPTSILTVMSSFPVRGDLLLSPLCNDFINLTEKGSLFNVNKCVPAARFCSESSKVVENGSDFKKDVKKVSREKKLKSMNRKKVHVDSKSNDSRYICDNNDTVPKKEVEKDTFSYDDLVSETLKLPILSSSYSFLDDSAKATAKASESSLEAFKDIVADKLFNDVAKEEPRDPIFNHEPRWDEKPKFTSVERDWEDNKISSLDDSSVYARKDGHFKGEKPADSVKSESSVSKQKKAATSEQIDSPKQKVSQRSTWHEQDNLKIHAKKFHLSSGQKSKSNGDQNHYNLSEEVPKESSRFNSSSVPKNSYITHVDTKKETEDLKSQKNGGKEEDMYKDFFGEMVDSEEENLGSPAESKDLEKVEKSTHRSTNTLKERIIGKKPDKLSRSEAYPKPLPSFIPQNVSGSISDATTQVTTVPVFIENWVCCDKCQKWRLLPLGQNPDSLPEKWLCSMLNWLPGMNRCSVSEEETSKALMDLYKIPHPQSQNNLHTNLDCTMPKVTADIQQPDQDLQKFGSHVTLSGGKRKQDLKEVSNGTNKEPTGLVNSVKKSIQTSIRSGNHIGTALPPLVVEHDIQKTNSSDLHVEKHKHKQKERLKVAPFHSDGGDTKSSNMKSKRDADQDCLRVSKKSKTDTLLTNGDDWASDHGVSLRNGNPSSSNGLATTFARKDGPKYIDRPSDGLSSRKERIEVFAKKPKEDIQVSSDDGSLDLGNSENMDGLRKRKVNESLEARDYMGSLPNTSYNLQSDRVSVKELSGNDRRKEKKAKISKSEGRESSVSKSSDKSDKKGSKKRSQQQGKDGGTNMSQRSLNGMDSLKKDFGTLQASGAATSSSSKVSSSYKTKASFHEAKGSPVESVSSSPMRLFNPDKLILGGRSLAGRDKSQDNGFFNTGSPRRSSDGEDDGWSDRTRIGRKEKHSVSQGGLIESSVLKPSPDVAYNHITNCSVDRLDQDTRYPGKPTTYQFHDEDRHHDSPYQSNGSRSRKSGKGSSSRSKDRNRSSRSGSINELQDHTTSYEVKPKDGRNKFEKIGVKTDENETRYADKKDPLEKLSTMNSQKEGLSNLDKHDRINAKVDAICSQDATSNLKQSLPQDYEGERSSKRYLPEKSDKARGKSVSRPPSGVAQHRLALGSNKVNVTDNLSADTSHGDVPKVPKQIKRNDCQNGIQQIGSRHPTSNGHKAGDPDAPSPLRKDSSNQAATSALKEAKDLKHLADRLKNSGSNLESLGLYFQAALKFLHGASILESCSIESSKHGEMIKSIQIYSSTAKLCEFCAHEYEKSKDMASAALAYKCMEAAYMRVIYSSHSSANRDRNELHTALQRVPPGESPSSSASDVDNLNHPATADKVASSKCVSSPQVAGNHVISARNRPNFARLLKFAQDVNLAMEASRKSQIAFVAANDNLREAQYKEAISSIKRALDFNFQDVEGLLRMVRLAMEAISR